MELTVQEGGLESYESGYCPVWGVVINQCALYNLCTSLD